jgi:azurin
MLSLIMHGAGAMTLPISRQCIQTIIRIAHTTNAIKMVMGEKLPIVATTL